MSRNHGKKRVAVLFGGRSAEHEISILSARFVVESLDRDAFEPVLIGITKDGRWMREAEANLLGQSRDPRLVRLNGVSGREGIVDARDAVRLPAHPSPADIEIVGEHGAPEAIDIVFPVLHGPMGEDGTLQGLLRMAEVPFVGSGVLGSAVGMDKDVMKRLFRDAGLPIVPHRTVRRRDVVRDREGVLRNLTEFGEGRALFIKPANLGSSVGVSRATSAEELDRAVDFALEFDDKIIVEQGLAGVRELECAILGNDEPIASVVGEVVVSHKDGFYSYDAKYVDGDGSHTVIPAELDAADVETVQSLAKRAFQVLECDGLARVDFFRGADGTVYLNEVNTMPGFTAISMYPKLFEASGVRAQELVRRLIDLGFERAASKQKLRTSV